MAATNVTAGNKITQSTDIANLIATINAETTRRGAGGGQLTATAQNSVAVGSMMTAAIAQNANINAVHTYGTGGHAGGTSKTPTASAASFSGGSMTATEYNKVVADINTLAAQCQCNTNACTANACTTNPGCNNCSCNVTCTCNGVCACVGQSNIVTCVQACYGQSCSCQAQCTCVSRNNTYCTGNGYYTTACNPNGCTGNVACTCNSVCSCEYN